MGTNKVTEKIAEILKSGTLQELNLYLEEIRSKNLADNNGSNMKKDDADLEKEEKIKEKKILGRNLNIVVAGKSGVGKSSLLNYLVGEDVFETGIGEPVTQDYFNLREFKSDKDVLYKLYDTKGIEPDTTEEFTKNVKGKIEEFSESDDIFDHVHTLYYCIAATSKRLEPFEIKFIKEIEKKLDVVIVLTKADLIKQEEFQEMSDLLRKELDASEDDIATSIKIVRVCSVEVNTRKGKSIPFGRENILNHIFIGLWNTFAKTASNQVWNAIFISNNTQTVLPKTDHIAFAAAAEIEEFEGKLRMDFLDLLLLYSLEDLEMVDLKENERGFLKIIFNSGEKLLENFKNYPGEFEKIEAELKDTSSQILLFYKEIFGNDVSQKVPFIKSKKKLDDISKYLIEEAKPFLQERIELVKDILGKDNSDDGFFSRLGSGDKRNNIRSLYQQFGNDSSVVYEYLRNMVKSFDDTCSTELSQYGVLKLKNNKNEELEQKLSEIYLENEKHYYDELIEDYSDDKIIDDKERATLNRLRQRFNISDVRALEIEEDVKKELGIQ